MGINEAKREELKRKVRGGEYRVDVHLLAIAMISDSGTRMTLGVLTPAEARSKATPASCGQTSRSG